MAVRQTKGKASWGKFYSGFSQILVDSGTHFTAQGAKIFTSACEKWLADQNAQWPRGEGGGAFKSGFRGGSYYYPWYTGTLHDSMATVVTDGNKVVSIRYMYDMSRSHAWADQTWKGQDINGYEWAALVANRSAHVFLPGIQMKLIVGAPYAQELNEKDTHAGFLNEFQRDFGSWMRGVAETRIKNIAFKAK